MDLNQILQDIVNEPYESLVGMARQAIAELRPHFIKMAGGDEDKMATVFVGYIMASLAADGKFTQKEYEFVCDVMQVQYTYEEVKELVKTGLNSEILSSLDSLFDDLPQELRSKTLLLCATFMAVDETISREEVALIHKLLAK